MCLQNSFRPIRRLLGDDPENELFVEYKKQTSAEEFCRQNKSKFLSEALDHIYSLKYEETPDYSKIIFLLKKGLMDMNLGPGGIFARRRNDNLING